MRALSVQISLRSLLARPLGKISIRDPSAFFFFMRSLYKSPLGKIYVRDLLARSLQQISMQGLQKRCPGKITVQDLKKRSLGEISVRGLWARSQQISMQCPCSRSLYEISCATDSETRAIVRRANVKRTVKQPSGCAQSPLSSAFPIIILFGNFLCSALVVLAG